LAGLVVLSEASYYAIGAVPVESHMARIYARGLKWALAPISAAGARILGRYATLGLAKSQAKQVIGFATFGLSILGEAALVYHTTISIGRHGVRTLRPWAGGILVDSGAAFDDPRARVCGARLLGFAIWADGTMEWQERALLAGYLSRRIYVSGAYRTMNTQAEMAEQAQLAADPEIAWADLSECVSTHFAELDVDTRHGLLATVLAVVSVDGQQTDAEWSRYAEVLEALRGDGYFDGVDALEEDDVAAVESNVATVFGISTDPYANEAGDDDLGVTDGTRPGPYYLVEGLSDVPAEVFELIPE
jgi:hypothetical protein